MDYLPDQETFLFLLAHYGSLALFGLLALGILALPIPEETLMVFTGAMIERGHLSLIPMLVSAYLGSTTGITMSYLIGRLAGIPLIHKYGKWIGLTDIKLKRLHNWFEKYGKWMLVCGYFIPGVRHFTGLFAGMTYLTYSSFALFAYSGAILWVTLFISVGYFLGNYGIGLLQMLEARIEIIAILIVCLLGSVLFAKTWWKKNNSKIV